MKKTNRKAFTVVELVIVIAVIAILAGVMIPTFGAIIKNAHISNDKSTAASINVALAAKLDGIDSPEEVYQVIAETFGADTAANFAPKSGKHGYHFWYDVNGNRVILETYENLGNHVSLASSHVDSGVSTIGKVENVATSTFALGSLRSFAVKNENNVTGYFYLIDKSGSEIVNDLVSLDICTSSTYKAIIEKFSSDSYKEDTDNKLANAILANLSEVVIANSNGMFAYDESTTAKALYVPEGTSVISDNVVIYGSTNTNLDLSGINSISLPSSIKNIQSYSMLGFAENATITVNTTEDNLDEIFAAESTNCIIQLPNGDSYKVVKDKIVKLDSDGNLTNTKISTAYTIPVDDMRLWADASKNNKIELVPQTDGSYNLYVAVDFTGDITLSVLDFLDKDGNKVSIDGETWSETSDNITYENGKFKVTGFAAGNDAYAGEISVNIQTLTKTIKVYGVKATNVKVDTTNNGGLNIEYFANGEDGKTITDVTITLPYNPSNDNTFNFTPSLVFNHRVTDIVLDGEIKVEAGAMSYSYDEATSKGALSLAKNTFADNAVTTLVVSYGDITSEVTYTVNLINNSDKSFDINEAYVTTETYKSLTKYYVGNAGDIKLSYLFKSIKNIEGQSIVVQVYQGNSKIGEYSYTSDVLNKTLNFSDQAEAMKAALNKDITIKIGIKGSAAMQEITVHFVAATNVTADTVGSMPSSTTADIVLLSNIDLTSAKELRKVYGNLHTISATTYTAEDTNYWNALITLYGQMDNTVVIGPTYNTVAFHLDGVNGTAPKAWDGVKLVSASSTITNSYLYGFRAPVSVVAGNGNSASPSTVKIENTTIEGGALANMHIGSVGNLILNNVNTVQDSNGYTATVGSGTAYGLGVYFDNFCQGTVTLAGNTRMYNWISKTEGNNLSNTKLYSFNVGITSVNIYTKDVITEMVDKGGAFLHSGYINTGFIEDQTSSKNTITSDNTYTGSQFTVTNGVEMKYKGWITLKTLSGWSIPTCTSNCTHTAQNFLPTGWSHQSTNHSANYLNGRIPAPTN